MMEGKDGRERNCIKHIQKQADKKGDSASLQQLLRLHDAVWCGASENSPHQRIKHTNRKNNPQNKIYTPRPGSHLTLRVALSFSIAEVF